MMTLTTSGVNHHFVTYTNDNGVIPGSATTSEVRTAPARPHPAIE